MGKKLLIVFHKKFYPNVLKVGKSVSQKLDLLPKVVLVSLPREEKEEVRKLLGKLGWNPEVVEREKDPAQVIREEKPYLVILPKPKVAPLVHIFLKPWEERFAEETQSVNLLLVYEETQEVKRALLYVDRDRASEDYIRESYNFLKRWGVEFEFLTVFDEKNFELLIRKEYPEQEAKELLGKMFEDYIEAVREKIKRVLGLEKVEIIPLKGEVRKSLPYFAKRHRYDLLVISQAYEEKDELVENSETCVALFKN